MSEISSLVIAQLQEYIQKFAANSQKGILHILYFTQMHLTQELSLRFPSNFLRRVKLYGLAIFLSLIHSLRSVSKFYEVVKLDSEKVLKF